MINDLTKEESTILAQWTAAGNDPNHYPWYMAGEDGRHLDFVSAWRIMLELADEHMANP